MDLREQLAAIPEQHEPDVRRCTNHFVTCLCGYTRDAALDHTSRPVSRSLRGWVEQHRLDVAMGLIADHAERAVRGGQATAWGEGHGCKRRTGISTCANPYVVKS